MMRGVPEVYTPEEIIALQEQTAAFVNGRWVAARPLGWQGWSLKTRARTAWKVFIGKWDALRWEGQE